MEDYETEDQQLAAIKKWWNENGTSLLIGLGVGVAALYGWNYYAGQQQQHSIEASDMHTFILSQVESRQVDDEVSTKANKLVTDYADTPYAALSSLALAKYEFTKGSIDASVSHLKWVAAHGVEDEVKNIARLRLARILLDQKKYDEAETWLMSEHPAAFEARYLELRGDLFVALGEMEQARVAYDKAIKGDMDVSQWLKLKRQDLGDPELSMSKPEELKPETSKPGEAVDNEPPV